MPLLGELARKAFTISGGRQIAFSGVNGQIEHNPLASITDDGALRVAAAWIANTVIADEVSALTSKIVRRGDNTRRPVEPPELPALTGRHPNPDQTRLGFWASSSLSLTLHGVSATMLGWTRDGTLEVMWPLDPLACAVSRMDDLGLRLTAPGKGELENHPGQRPQFMWIPLYTLPGRLQPVSPVQYAAELLGLGASYNTTAALLMKRGYNPAAIVTSDETIPDDIAQKLSARMMSLHGGENAGGVAVLGGKGLKLERLAMSMADAQFMAQKAEVFAVTMALWRVPPTVAGMVDKPSTWGTGIAEFSRGLERFTLRPIVQRLQAGVEAFITEWVDPTLQYRFVFDSMLSASPKERLEIQRLGLMAGITSQERVLAQNDEPPFDGEETVYTQLALATGEDRRLAALRAQAEVYGALVRAGATPETAAWVAGLAGIEHTGLRPVTVAADDEP